MTEWQPIETAPKDGTRFLAYLPDGRITIAWTGYVETGSDTYIGVMDSESRELETFTDPTHWMPLPTPPEQK